VVAAAAAAAGGGSSGDCRRGGGGGGGGGDGGGGCRYAGGLASPPGCCHPRAPAHAPERRARRALGHSGPLPQPAAARTLAAAAPATRVEPAAGPLRRG
jgi:hypothetical protein